MRRDVFQAIADPNRRAILAVLAKQPLNLNAVADQFHISRPAISKHMKILAECGLVVFTQQGRERYCEVRVHKLNEVSEWVQQYRELWSQRLDALDAYLQEIQKSDEYKAKQESQTTPAAKKNASKEGGAKSLSAMKKKSGTSAQNSRQAKVRKLSAQKKR